MLASKSFEVLENIGSHAVVVLDKEKKIVSWNRAAEEIFSWRKEEVIGNDYSSFIKDNSVTQLVESVITKPATASEAAGKKYWCLAKDKKPIHVTSQMSSLSDPAGEITGYISILKNSTQEQLDLEALRSSELRYKVGTNVTRNAIWDWNIQTDELVWSDALRTELKYSTANLKQNIEWWKSRIHPEDRDRVFDRLSEHVKSDRKFWNDEYRFQIGTGTYRTFRDRGQLIRKIGGDVRLIGAMKDITQERESSQQLKQSEERMKFALGSAQMGEYEIDVKRLLFIPSQQIEKIFGHKNLAGNLFEVIQRVVHPDDIAMTIDRKNQAIASGTLYTDEFRVIKFDGSIAWVRAKGKAHHDESGKPVKFYGVIQDITESKLLEAELRKAKQDAEVANQSKSAFLANMSHEIRTPMTAVLGFAEILRDPEITEEVRSDAISRIEGSGRALLRLIEDILDISKIEAGQPEIQYSVFSPVDVVSDVVGLLRITSEKKGVHIQIEIDPQVPLQATSDPIRLRQILVNLIGNAVKFTAQGTIVVRISAENEKDIIFEVRDMGIGIASKDIKNLFLPFSQGDETIARKFGGTGLGLFISKRLAQRLGGDLILAESKGQRGASFIAKINAHPFTKFQNTESLQTQLHPTRNFENTADIAGTKVLLAEDVLDNQVLMKMYLEKAGVEVEIANNGDEAINAALHKKYDLILMDIQMPVTDGLQATKHLRKQGFRGPIVALSANAMSEDISRSIEAGCNAHLTKPITKFKLIEAIQNFKTQH